MTGTRIRRIREAFLDRQGRFDFIFPEDMPFEIGSQGNMARRLDFLDVRFFELLNIIQDALKLDGEGVQLLFAEMKLCQIGYFQHFGSGYGHG